MREFEPCNALPELPQMTEETRKATKIIARALRLSVDEIHSHDLVTHWFQTFAGLNGPRWPELAVGHRGVDFQIKEWSQ